MNWQFPTLLGQSDLESLRERTEAVSLPDTAIPDSALHRESNWNIFGSEYWFPEQASEFAPHVDYVYMGIFWISLVFFVGIIGTMMYFVVKYRRRGNVIAPLPSPSHNTGIEILWSVIPSILLVWIFYEGAVGYFDMKVPKEDAEEIQVMASKWNWVFTYPDGDISPELHLVRDRPTKLVLQSKDVLHSLYIPAFRQKMDIVPGRYTYAYMVPNKTGTYRLTCAEYCGQGHSKMKTAAIVHETAADRKTDTKWIESEYTPWENGERLYKIHCSGCHRVDGTDATGPALNDIWNKQEDMVDGSKILVDRKYVQDSLWIPRQDVVAGFGPESKMNSFKGLLNEEKVNFIIAYLKYLKDPSLVGDELTGEKKPDSEDESEPDSEADAETKLESTDTTDSQPETKPENNQ